MVSQKRLDCGSWGSPVHPMPQVPKSAKGKRTMRKKFDDSQISAIDLLASVAGELLTERENPPRPGQVPGTLNPTAVNGVIKQEQRDNVPIKAEVFDQGSCDESTLGTESVFKSKDNLKLNEPPKTPELGINEKRGEFGCCPEGFSSGLTDLSDYKAELGIKTPLQAERRSNGNVMHGNAPGILEDPMNLDGKPPALVSSESSVEVPSSRNGFYHNCGDKMGIEDPDDENSSGCTQPSTHVAKAFRPQRIGDRRVRKLLASKFWKAQPTALVDRELRGIDGETKPGSRRRKVCYSRLRTERASFKRRKLSGYRAVSSSVAGIHGEDYPRPSKFDGKKVEGRDGHAYQNGAYGASSSTSAFKSCEPGDFNVKFEIKSFKVPELFIEIPETATVGSLKRTVMEAVSAIFAGGLRVGVLLQGKKVRDDKQTLVQAGISQSDKMENLGFTLESNSTQTPQSLVRPSVACPEDLNSLLPSPNPVLPCSNPVLSCASVEAMHGIAVPDPVKDEVPPVLAAEQPQTSTMNCPESDHDSVHSHTDASSAEKTASSKALVPVPDMNTDPLAVVPPRKSKQSEMAQRRIRRPFSVTEVEALVQAVERLGTGRWRDVKIRAFDNAKHRTYVDLKDKWKTLVHTASISPQQRRGEPVPQELLDRVLSAHSYWTQQQARLQTKPSQAETCLLI